MVSDFHRREAAYEYYGLLLARTIGLTFSEVYRKTREAREQRRVHVEPAERTHQTLKLSDQYIALMVLVFTNAGLLDVRTPILSLSFP